MGIRGVINWWEVGEKDKEGRLRGKGEKRMGGMLTVDGWERKSRRIIRMGRGEWEKKVVRWEVG
jgi:hypothetical protein